MDRPDRTNERDLSVHQNGPAGLLENKRVVIGIASGRTQGGSDIDFARDYLTHVLGFLGVKDVQSVSADRVVARGDTALMEGAAQVDDLAA